MHVSRMYVAVCRAQGQRRPGPHPNTHTHTHTHTQAGRQDIYIRHPYKGRLCICASYIVYVSMYEIQPGKMHTFNHTTTPYIQHTHTHTHTHTGIYIQGTHTLYTMRICEIDPCMDSYFSCVPSGEGPLLPSRLPEIHTYIHTYINTYIQRICIHTLHSNACVFTYCSH
jgi:hypothetical protein